MFSQPQINESYSQGSSELNQDLASILNTPIPKIKVIIRKRPLNSKEINKKETDIISIKDHSKVIVSEQKIGLDLTKYIDKKEFLFDNAYDEFSTNEIIYIQNIRPMIFGAFYSKYKITCFAYGQTGSGKTYTMMGSNQGTGIGSAGMYMLAGYDIFNILNNDNKFSGFKILVSFYEIYCDKLFDLLNNKNKLETREDKKHNINIVGLSENCVNSLNDLMNIINFGLKQRTVGKTGANSDSSRSHGIIQIRVVNQNNKEHGKITFIDLAGSEREVDKININKKTRIDGAEINKSLLALKECIRALDQDKSHTPFRGSKLTIVLRDSFIGNCKILMIANISPGNNSSDHTLNTLRYAERAKELKKTASNKNNNFLNKNQYQSQGISNIFNNKKNKENKSENSLNTSVNSQHDNKNNLIKKKPERKSRNSSSSSSGSFHNKLNENKNKLGKKSVNINSINNILTQTQSNNFNNNMNSEDYSNKRISSLFINNNTNINSYSLSFLKNENNNNNNNNLFQDDLSTIKSNQSFCSFSNNNNIDKLFELEQKNNDIIKSIVVQDALCKENQQKHINALCESLKIEMITFQQYQKNELQITTYIDSMQNIFKNQMNQINEMNNQLEKLKNMINQQAKVANLIDAIKNGQNQNNLVNNLFDLNNLNY